MKVSAAVRGFTPPRIPRCQWCGGSVLEQGTMAPHPEREAICLSCGRSPVTAEQPAPQVAPTDAAWELARQRALQLERRAR